MRLFDLHCDTIGECCKQNEDLCSNDLHISLSRASQLDSYTQVFAIWIPDELRGIDAVRYFDKVCDYYYEQLWKNEKIISDYYGAGDTKIKAILAVEGGAAIAGSIDGLYHLKERGVKIMTLTWNAKNEIASGAYEPNGGLTEFGRETVHEMEKLGMIIDVSHLNRKSFFDVCACTSLPFIASHSNADIVNTPAGKRRNLTDEQISIIKKREGLIGLNFYKEFLETADFHGIKALYRQIEHFLTLGCEDIIALGSDFDGCSIDSELSGVEKMNDAYSSLLSLGLDEKLLNKIFYENAERFLAVSCK